MFNFENYLLQELNNDKIIVLNEQMFVKNGELDPNKIYVVTKYLTSSIEYGAETAPVQILVLSEQNGVQEAHRIFDEYTQTHNWVSFKIDDTFVKQQYSSPVVMSNFQEAAYGYRSVLYISATLFLMKNIQDVKDLKINGVLIKPFNFTWSYQMTGNTQPISGDMIASTVKNISTFQATLSIPILGSYIPEEIDGGYNNNIEGSDSPYRVDIHSGYTILAEIAGGTITSINQETGDIYFTLNEGIDVTRLEWSYEGINLLDTLMNISSGNLSGNTNIKLEFEIFNILFEFDCKLTSVQMTSTPNDIPTLQVGIQR